MADHVKQGVARIAEALVSWRRALHRIPELGFEEEALQIRLVEDYPARRDRPPRVDHPMPWNLAAVAGRCVHRPADESRAVALVHEPRDLAVGHHLPSRNSKNHPIDLLEDLLVTRSNRVRGRCWLSRFLCHQSLSLAFHRTCPGLRRSIMRTATLYRNRT